MRPFTPAEDQAILRAKAAGLSYRNIGDAIGRSRRSVEMHYLRSLQPGATRRVTFTIPRRHEQVIRAMVTGTLRELERL